jgi:hypothetical protein
MFPFLEYNIKTAILEKGASALKRLVAVLKVTVLFSIVLGIGIYTFNRNPQLKGELLEKKEQLDVAVMANKLLKADNVESFEKIIEDNSRLIDNLLEKEYLSDGDLTRLQQLLNQWKQTGNDFKGKKIQSLLVYLESRLGEEDYQRVEQLLREEKINFKAVQELYEIWKDNRQKQR